MDRLRSACRAPTRGGCPAFALVQRVAPQSVSRRHRPEPPTSPSRRTSIASIWPHRARARSRRGNPMDSTMQDVPLTIAAIMRYACDRARRPHGDDGDRRRVPAHDLPGGRRAGRPAGECVAPHRHHRRPARRDLHVEQRRAPGRPTWRSRRWARCCTRSTSGCRPSRSRSSPTRPRTRSIIADLSLAGQLAPVLPTAGDRAHRDRRRRRRHRRADRVRQDRAALRRGRSRPSPPSSTGRTSTRSPRPQCATPAERPETRKALSTAIVRAICTAMMINTANGMGLSFSDKVLPDRADVPRQRLGAAVRAR